MANPSVMPGARAQPMIAVKDVRASARWYAEILGAQRTSITMGSDHAHLYDRVMIGGSLILQLHAWDEESHPNLVDANAAPLAHGVVLWFEVDDLDAAVKRAHTLKAEVIEDVHFNPAPRHREIWLRDPDGYVVALASPGGEA